MKKEVQAQLEALATEILSKKGQQSTASLKKKVLKIYDQLCVLQHLERQLGIVEDTTAKDSKSYREDNWFVEPEPVPQPQHEDDIAEPVIEKIKDLVAQMPQESQKVDELLEEILPEKKYVKNDLEEFAATYQETPTFERKKSEPILEEKMPAKGVGLTGKKETLIEKEATKSIKPKSLNDTATQGLKIGLNDRLAFVKHLFDDDTAAYKRVLSQLETMQSWDDASTFIKGKIKPDYNYWLGKEEYGDRFMAIVEKSYS